MGGPVSYDGHRAGINARSENGTQEQEQLARKCPKRVDVARKLMFRILRYMGRCRKRVEANADLNPTPNFISARTGVASHRSFKMARPSLKSDELRTQKQTRKLACKRSCCWGRLAGRKLEGGMALHKEPRRKTNAFSI